ncbi:MAG: hypothetical protein A2173_03795 [Planctomycetes bacterium RBG_13_44_8b]|nr:MAG: hypothetical protein A2173_03795 [Planctomycetes bacterium RBG_13_44_8b]
MTREEQAKLDIIAQAALSTLPTLYFSFDAAETIINEGIEGDMVECGVYAGAQCAAMALAVQKHQDKRKIHLFDSFEGIPQAGPNDDPCLSGESVSSIENTQHFMKLWGIDPERLVYHKGWFKDTIAFCGIDKIAILRLDGDLYESTKICLRGLYPALVKKGFCIIDDYALSGCKKAVSKYFCDLVITKKGKLPEFIPIKGGHGPVWFRKS